MGHTIHTMVNRNRLILVSAMLLSACGSIEGQVRDGVTGEVLPNARVTLHYSNDPSGFFDSPKVENAKTNSVGQFVFDQESGFRLEVSTTDGHKTAVSLCPKSPFTVYIDSPYPQLKFTNRLILTSSGTLKEGEVPKENRSSASELGISVTAIDTDDSFTLSLRAEGGMALVEGTGAVPSAPALPYKTSLDLDFEDDCGWIFVEQGGRIVAVIEARPFDRLSLPDGYHETSLMFAELP